MRALLLVVVPVVASCGGTSSEGSIEGRAFRGNVAYGTLTQSETRIVVEENVNVCQNKSAAGGRRNSVVMALSQWNGSQLLPATTPGIYTVEATFCKTDNGKIQSSCGLDGKDVPAGARYAVVHYTRDADVAPNKALAGYVRLSGVSASNGGSVGGDYELFFDTGDRLSGSFNGSLCEL